MGNTPAKESHRASGSPAVDRITLAMRRRRRDEEREQAREQHYRDLVVRYREAVDGGYLAPHGVYSAYPDYDTQLVRGLVIARKLAPFYLPIEEYESGWLREETAAQVWPQLRLHRVREPGEEVDDADTHRIHQLALLARRRELKLRLERLVNEVAAAALREEARFAHDTAAAREAGLTRGAAAPGPPPYPFVMSDDLVAALYGQAVECPICFDYYPPFLNLLRCCAQPICSECFCQIKRLDPHPPHGEDEVAEPEQLILEPALCPFCGVPDFGVTYTPPAWRVGLGASTTPSEFRFEEEAVESDEAASSPTTPPLRRGLLAATAPGVVSIDYIKPDWEAQLALARLRMARRSAAATAIHALSLLLSPQSPQQRDSIEERMVQEALRLSLLEQTRRSE